MACSEFYREDYLLQKSLIINFQSLVSKSRARYCGVKGLAEQLRQRYRLTRAAEVGPVRERFPAARARNSTFGPMKFTKIIL